MGRKPNPIEDLGPIGQFATKLRQRIEQEDPTPTYRDLAAKVNYSYATLAGAASGRKLPTWEATVAVLHGCDAGDEEIEQWHNYWKETRLKVTGRLPDPMVPDPQGWVVEPKTEPDRPDLSGYDDWRPHPELVGTFDDLAYQLQRFRAAVGNPTLRALLYDLRNQAFRGPEATCSLTALSEIFNGKRRPRALTFRALLTVLLLRSHAIHGLEERDRTWKSDYEWTEAWSRAEFHHQQSRRPNPSTAAATSHQTGAGLANLATTKPKELLNLLIDMNPADASRIITALPEPTGTEILTAVLETLQARARPTVTTGPTAEVTSLAARRSSQTPSPTPFRPKTV
ncbi:hypothetical protein [Nocardia sp. NPDC051570]|uniref:hypothetical protein n=1 Tax=Nocardia sp. NPDC051570 TaxID=3364324 RepID=UPI0037AFAF2C